MAFTVPKVEHINPFLNATKETFSTMVNMEAKPSSKPYLKQGEGTTYDVSGVIGLSGDAKGSISISFPRTTVLKVVSEFLGEKVTSLDDDVSDAVGEIINIVAGAAKKDLTSFNITISLPTVVMGAGHKVQQPKDVMSMIIPFKCDAGEFDVAINLKSNS